MRRVSRRGDPSRQMYTSGASVTDIRAAIEKEWSAHSTSHTPTPEAPHHH